VDRAAARRSLWRFLSPADSALKAASHAEFIAALHALETLVALAQPLSPALEAHLAPWFVESQRRRQQILTDNRRADARFQRNSSEGR
jgi:hypothetical protein